MENIKEWTLLIYAGGNNEMEPEMYKAMLEAQKVGSNSNVNVVMEIGRMDRELTKIMRPSENFNENDDNWSGVRKYYIEKGESILIEDLGQINMADPKILQNFLKWGMDNYKARKYMLILAGHGISFVGMLTDLSQGMPYMMCIPEVNHAIDLATKDSGNKINILILDTCYMNSVEVIYEFSQGTVNNILTYIDEGPFKGMPYDTLISMVQDYSYINEKDLIKRIIDKLDFDLIGFEITYDKLEEIKKAFSDLAYTYLENKKEWDVSPKVIMSDFSEDRPWHNYLDNINKALSSIIICYKQNYNKDSNLIKVIGEDINDLIIFYNRLGFAKDNDWIYLLSNKDMGEFLNIEVDQRPILLPHTGLITTILSINPSLKREDAELIIKQIMSKQR